MTLVYQSQFTIVSLYWPSLDNNVTNGPYVS